ncbi:glutathione peroxidase [Histidinibacterium aquaticum]|nr:glutathione peroxidase [Histidinibacterium aquaticum]
MPHVTLNSIDGGEIDLGDYAGKPILLVNTASLCAFTPQFAGLQDLWDAYRSDGLMVLAVPSDDFRQELENEEAVRDYCAMHFGIDMPMTAITPVLGEGAHPLYLWLAGEGVVPKWNFHKVLIDRDGRVITDWPSAVQPMSPMITEAVEGALGG